MDLSKYSEWKEIYDIAESNMVNNSLDKNRDGLLIEIAAQHPLKDGVYPDIEFKLRLDLGIRLYNNYKDLGNRVKIYVPGSLHTVDCYSKFHNYIDELFLNIPIVIDGGSSLEKELERLREERKVK